MENLNVILVQRNSFLYFLRKQKITSQKQR